MKVCTDSSLFGAVIDSKNAKNILDIGTGTGVLALMQAQKSKAKITAVEIEPNACAQAVENFRNSPWHERMKLIESDVVQFARENTEKFDLILSNPPFFKANLKSPNSETNLARHDQSLTLEQLAETVLSLLSDDGCFWVLLPNFEFQLLNDLLKDQLHLTNEFQIADNPNKLIIRKIGCFSKMLSTPTQVETIYIKTLENTYSTAFKVYLKDYYLIF